MHARSGCIQKIRPLPQHPYLSRALARSPDHLRPSPPANKQINKIVLRSHCSSGGWPAGSPRHARVRGGQATAPRRARPRHMPAGKGTRPRPGRPTTGGRGKRQSNYVIGTWCPGGDACRHESCSCDPGGGARTEKAQCSAWQEAAARGAARTAGTQGTCGGAWAWHVVESPGRDVVGCARVGGDRVGTSCGGWRHCQVPALASRALATNAAFRVLSAAERG